MEKSSQETFQSTKDKFFDFVDAAVKKIKELDLDLNFGKHHGHLIIFFSKPMRTLNKWILI